MQYTITAARKDGTYDCFYLESETAPVPPESGNSWAVDAINTMENLSDVNRIEIAPADQSASPTYVWDCDIDYLTGPSESVWMEGWESLAPTIPGSGTWWATKAVVEGESACVTKYDLYIRIANIDAFTASASSTTC